MKEQEHLPVFSEAAEQICLCLSSLPSFSSHQSGSTPCQKSLVCFALGVSVGPITVSHWLLGALRPGMKQQKKAKHAWMRWLYFSVLSYAFDPAQLSEVWHLINLAFFSFSPFICLTHLPSAFSRSHSFSASLSFLPIQAFPAGIWSQKQNQWKSPSRSPSISLIRIKMLLPLNAMLNYIQQSSLPPSLYFLPYSLIP